MSDWSAYFIAFGFAVGCYFLGAGLESFGEQLVLGIKEWWEGRHRFETRRDG